jgi:hypothetical protein
MKTYVAIALAIVLVGAGFYMLGKYSGGSNAPSVALSDTSIADDGKSKVGATPITPTKTTPAPTKPTTSSAGTNGTSPLKAYTINQLTSLADARFISGEVPLGDNKYVTSTPKKGYVFLCSATKHPAGSMVNGLWIHGSNWNFLQKVAVTGGVTWPTASFSDTVTGTVRSLVSKALPTMHTTGTFPVAKTDPAALYDPNPNAIQAQSLSLSLPVNPTFSNTPYCVGMGPIGMMITGVPLYNAFDAGLRDAPAHELQDSCGGHPQQQGEYHYHNLSSCIKNASVARVLGYAYDGYPITGPEVYPGQFLTTEDLDVCHGITSDVQVDGQTKTTYHYVMTQDFPYSISCFRAKPTHTAP